MDESINWKALVDEFKQTENLLSMAEFCKLKKVEMKAMKYHYYEYNKQYQNKLVEIHPYKRDSNVSYIVLEYKGFKLKLTPGFNEESLKSILRCLP